MSPVGTIVAIGDSLVNGHGAPLLGVQSQSFALWTAAALDFAFVSYARGGATSADIAAHQLSRLDRRHDIAIVGAGANDVLQHRPVAEFASNLGHIAAAAADHAEHVVLLMVPPHLGCLPGRNLHQAVAAANRVIVRVAHDHGCLLLETADIHGMRAMKADQVHPTALGQFALGERTVALLASTGLTAVTPPSVLTLGHPGRRLPLGYVATYPLLLVRETVKQVIRRVVRSGSRARQVMRTPDDQPPSDDRTA